MKFDHHPNPAIDFCVECEEIESIYIDQLLGLGSNPHDFRDRLQRALWFNVGGDPNCVAAKIHLRVIVDRVKSNDRSPFTTYTGVVINPKQEAA